jgi:hypothetical protein
MIAPARAIRPPIHIQVTSGLTMTRKTTGASSVMYLAAICLAVSSCSCSILASACGRSWGLANAARIRAPNLRQLGGTPGPPRTHFLKTLSAARAWRWTPVMSGLFAVQKSVKSPAHRPMSLSASPSK